jgi:hypothetical protein
MAGLRTRTLMRQWPENLVASWTQAMGYRREGLPAVAAFLPTPPHLLTVNR